MEAIVIVSRFLLAGVLLVAGAAKLVDRAGSRRALADFGVPRAVVGVGAVALPILEIGVGLTLLPRVTAWYAAISALALLAAFSAGIAYQMARGRSPECHCFGGLSSSRAGPATLARNVALGGLGLVVAAQGPAGVGPGPVEWLVEAGPAWQVGSLGVVILALLMARGAWLLLEIVRQQGRLLIRIEALEAMAVPRPSPVVVRRAPSFELPGLDGRVQTLEGLLERGRPVLLAFIDPGCGACDALLPDIEGWQTEGAGLTVAIIGRGSAERMHAKVGRAAVRDVVLQKGHEVSRAYGSTMTPAAVLIGADGMLRTAPALGVAAIRALVSDHRARHQALPEARTMPSGTAATVSAVAEQVGP